MGKGRRAPYDRLRHQKWSNSSGFALEGQKELKHTSKYKGEANMLVIYTKVCCIRNKWMELVSMADESYAQIDGNAETWLTETVQILHDVDRGWPSGKCCGVWT